MDIVKVNQLPPEDEDYAAVVKYVSPKDGRITHYLTGSAVTGGSAVFLKSEYGRYDSEEEAISVAKSFAVEHGFDRVLIVDQTNKDDQNG